MTNAIKVKHVAIFDNVIAEAINSEVYIILLLFCSLSPFNLCHFPHCTRAYASFGRSCVILNDALDNKYSVYLFTILLLILYFTRG